MLGALAALLVVGLDVVELGGAARSVGLIAFAVSVVSAARLLQAARREWAEADLSNRRYRELFEGMRDAVFESDFDGRTLSMNPAGVELLGFRSEEELLDVDIRAQIYVDPAARDELLRRVAEEGFVRDFPTTLRRRDGVDIFVEITSTARRGADGSLLGTRGTIRDVTEARLARAKIVRLQELNRNIVESLPQGFFVLDRHFRVVYFNRALERISGMSRPDLIGRVPWEIHSYLCDEGFEAGVRRAFEGETVTRLNQPLQLGQGFATETFSPLRDRDGRTVGVVGFVEDTTDRQALEQQLIQAEKISAMGRMISGLAHEINNPLTAVHGYAQLLHRSLEPGGVRDDVGKILDSSERCRKVVQGLLSYTRKHEHRLEPVDPREVIARTLELVEAELAIVGVEVRRDDASEVCLVRADANQLQQVLLNLFQNAIDELRTVSGEKSIRVATRGRGSQVTIVVANSGPHITDEDLSRLFDPFFTTKEVGRGTGLGLSVANNIVRNHRGTIAVRNAPNGVEFEVNLPRVLRGEEPPAPETSGAALGRDGAPSLDGLRVAVVDVEEEIRELCVSELQAALSVETFDDARSAMFRISSGEPIDVLVIDHRIPGDLTGPDLVRWVVANRPELTGRVILLTSGMPTVAESDRDAFEASAVLVKPFSLAEFRDLVASVGARPDQLPRRCSSISSSTTEGSANVDVSPISS